MVLLTTRTCSPHELGRFAQGPETNPLKKEGLHSSRGDNKYGWSPQTLLDVRVLDVRCVVRGTSVRTFTIQYEHTTVLHTGETGGVDRAMQRIDRVLHREPLLRR